MTMTETSMETHATKGDKVKLYGWKVVDDRGEFMWVEKRLLRIDHSYQRERVTTEKVLSFAQQWSWIACGVLVCADRGDGYFYIIDGQHRKLAADRRSDIPELPCMIYRVADISEEADGFVRANVHRGPVKGVEQFKARLVARDDAAVRVARMVEETGYRIASGGMNHTASCVATLMRITGRNEEMARGVWKLCCELSNGECVHRILVDSLFFLENHLQKSGDSIHKANNRSALIRLGAQSLSRACANAEAYYGKGGEKVWAQGIISVLSKGRRTNRIEPLY